MLASVSKLRAASRLAALARQDAAQIGAAAQAAVGPGAAAGTEPATPSLLIGSWLHKPAVWEPWQDTFPSHVRAGAQPGFGHDKEQGQQGDGGKPAENPRNDVPPVSPEERKENPELPPSPDETSGEANNSRYSSPGTHPGSDGRDGAEPDMDNASEAVKQQAAGAVKFQDEAQGSQSRVEMHQYVMEKSPNLRAHGGVSAAPAEDQTQQKARDSVFTAPVETLMETPLEAADADDGSTGPASVDDDPPGVQHDPNTVPPSDDQKGTDKGSDN